jgi:hypothetical protein
MPVTWEWFGDILIIDKEIITFLLMPPRVSLPTKRIIYPSCKKTFLQKDARNIYWA